MAPSPSAGASSTPTPYPPTQKKDLTFWLILLSLCFLGFAAALDNTIVFTALPTIVSSLSRDSPPSEYVWIANAYALSSTVIQPFVAQACNVFGRKSPALLSVALFAVGGGIAGGASGMAMLIAGRTVQGLGAGGIFVLLELIVCDLLPQRERGKYVGVVLGSSAVGSLIGPLVGGALADANWRWVFYITLPFAGVGLVWMGLFLRLKYRTVTTWRGAIRQMDIVGNVLFIGAITAILLGLLMGGITFPWQSANVVVPLVLGFVGWAAFHFYESRVAEPTVPQRLFVNRNAAIGFFLTFEMGIFLGSAGYFLPLYFQALKGASPLASGVDTLPFNAFMMPAAVGFGGLMAKTGFCRPIHATAWGSFALAYGLLSTLTADSTTAEWVIYQLFLAIGIGASFVTILPAIQSTFAESDVAVSSGTFSFIRSFGIVWGTTIPTTIFNSQINANIDQVSDPAIRAVLANGGAYEFASVGIGTLPPTVRSEVVALYTSAIKPVWQVMLAFALLGFIVVLFEKPIELRQELDTEFGIDRAPDTKVEEAKQGVRLTSRKPD
ncbi:hypothetical protein MMC10_010383 [Thelotrema lepadinum]|nr:hypothetical protein [Thelotrema lepadinum]